MKLHTIGFTKTTAASFFTRLANAGVKKVIDVRLNNISQLAGFAKKDDLRYFLKAICGIGYAEKPAIRHMPAATDRDCALKLARRRQGVTVRARTLGFTLVLTRLVASGARAAIRQCWNATRDPIAGRRRWCL